MSKGTMERAREAGKRKTPASKQLTDARRTFANAVATSKPKTERDAARAALRTAEAAESATPSARDCKATLRKPSGPSNMARPRGAFKMLTR